MKFHKELFALACCSVMLTGCSRNAGTSSELPNLDSIIQQENQESPAVSEPVQQESESLPEETAGTVSADVYYLTDHGTQNPEQLSKFRAQLETDGFVWNECTISEIPADAGILICNSPQEDITQEELKILKNYTDTGGDVLFLLPASESETRYKFLGSFLETFCIQMDYDRVTDPQKEDEPLLLQIISIPDRMPEYEESMSVKPVYMRNMRSFHMLGDYATDELFIDVMLQTLADVKGEPCGGTEDDPVTYENEKLNILVYSRNEFRGNTSVVVCGASDFLNDENFDADKSRGAKNWIYSSLQWFVNYNS